MPTKEATASARRREHERAVRASIAAMERRRKERLVREVAERELTIATKLREAEASAEEAEGGMTPKTLAGLRSRVENGSHFWAAPFRRWLVAKREEHGLPILAEWAGMTEKNLRNVINGFSLQVKVDVVDRCLLWEGTTSIDELYPLQLELDDVA